MSPRIAHVALPVPLHKTFDYLIGDMIPVIGGRVLVPFGRQKKIGIVVGMSDTSSFSVDQLKMLIEVIDFSPLWSSALFKLLNWSSQYYQYPLGEVIDSALPVSLRKGKVAEKQKEKHWQLTELGRIQQTAGQSRAPKQARVLTLLREGALAHAQLIEQDVSTAVLNALVEKAWIAPSEPDAIQAWQSAFTVLQQKPRLNEEQAIAVACINAQSGFTTYLVEGVTGSGKTEVYLNVIEPVLREGKQALVLVPEIGLTPQTIARFAQRFNVPISVLHSGLNETERHNAWVDAKQNQAGIIIGTRSALFSPCQHLGVIIVDEEHDLSYKQQESFRYHARDLAVMRGYEENIPVVLGSATPSLESLHNALNGKYQHLTLNKRAGNATTAKHQILDMRGQYHEGGLSAALIAEIRAHLSAGNQVMLFLNRRGYAPVMMCHECGWLAECKRCDTYFTLHQHIGELHCHHCASQYKVPHQCADCGSTQLISVGVGTEQLEKTLTTLFPEYRTIRIDRDNTRRKGALDSFLNAIYNNEYQLLIGTQMLAKGHHFPNVTLVALVDVDGALFCNDFRAAERLAQLFVQVAGRAGRASKPGKVLLQTHHPEHSLLQLLVHRSYHEFAQSALAEREQTQLPPYRFLILFRAEGLVSDVIENFLMQVRHILETNPIMDERGGVFGPSPAPMAKRAGKYRWQLIFQAPSRKYLQQVISVSFGVIQQLPLAKKVRWSVDIEPQDMS